MCQNLFNFTFVLLVSLLLGENVVINSWSGNSKDSIESAIKQKEKEDIIEDPCTTEEIYLEKKGLVRVDIKNLNKTSNGWTADNTLSGFEGSDYLVWIGADNFNTPGQGIIKFSIKINNPGTYQFVWCSRITSGTSNTEHNDSWLRIKGDNFYGKKLSTGQCVYPKGSGKKPNPVGTSKDGWLKVYMNGLDEWLWKSNTNDKDPYDVFVTFNKQGIYVVEISGRSKLHAIDQFVMFKSGSTLLQAKNAALSEIICKNDN